MKTKFTVKALEKLVLKEKRYNIFDTDTRGLGLAVYPTGQKTFFHLRKVQGWPRRETIAPFPDINVEQARRAASDLNSRYSKWKLDNYEGPEPFKARSKIATLGDVFEHYLEHHLRAHAKNGERAVKDTRWQFDCYLASWRHRPLSSIHREHVRELHGAIGAKHGQVTANRTITFLRTVFNHAIHPDVALWAGVNPCAQPKKFLFHEKSRTRIIQDSEKPKFFKALETEPHRDLRDFLLLALSTGARRGTIFAMRWDELDWERALWTITNPKGKQNSEPHVVTLPKLAVAVLKARPRVSEYVFFGRTGHLTTLRKPWARFIARAGLSNLNVHDLRRTLATQEGETGASTEVIQRTLGHAASSVATKIYDRSQRRDDVRDAMTAAMAAMLATGKTSEKKLLAVPRGQ